MMTLWRIFIDNDAQEDAAADGSDEDYSTDETSSQGDLQEAADSIRDRARHHRQTSNLNTMAAALRRCRWSFEEFILAWVESNNVRLNTIAIAKQSSARAPLGGRVRC